MSSRSSDQLSPAAATTKRRDRFRWGFVAAFVPNAFVFLALATSWIGEHVQDWLYGLLLSGGPVFAGLCGLGVARRRRLFGIGLLSGAVAMIPVWYVVGYTQIRLWTGGHGGG